MRKRILVTTFLLALNLTSCEDSSVPNQLPVASFDFPLPASAEVKYAFYDEAEFDKSFVIGTDDTLEQNIQFIRDSMKASAYELVEETVVNSDTTALTFKKLNVKILFSLLNIPVGNKKTSICIIYPKEIK